jgi:DNA-binding transcriptional LysR family regulator
MHDNKYQKSGLIGRMNLLRSMDVVLTVADQKSMTAAAKKLGTSLPTVVRIVAELEVALSVRLFNRTTRHVSLTEDGELYCEHCRRILAEVDNLENIMAGARDEPVGQVSVTASLCFGERHVAPVLAELAKQNSGLHLRLFLADRVVDFVEEHIDIAVRIGHLQDSSLIARKIGEVQQVLCASPETVRKFGVPDHPRKLSALPCVQLYGNNAGTSWPFQEGGRRLAVAINGVFICNSVQPAVNACIDGAGYGLFLSYQVKDAVGDGRLLTLLDDFQPPAQPVNLVFSNAKLLTSRMRYVLDALKAGVRI